MDVTFSGEMQTETMSWRNGDFWRFVALAKLREFLGDVDTSVLTSSNAHADVRVVRVQDIPPMILLELRLIHEQGLGLGDAFAIGDIFPG